ncbi:MAG: LPS export ABC transporter periplasmic protein LptC, partial [Rikenellaceae bacterium]
YKLAKDPYMIFTKGIHIETYDSIGTVRTMLDALYAHYDENSKVWEAKGNVVARDSSGKTLYTQQIYWDQKKQIIYSNVDTKVVNGDEITVGSGFESDDKLENIQFKQTKGRIYVDTTKNENPDSSAVIKNDSLEKSNLNDHK